VASEAPAAPAPAASASAPPAPAKDPPLAEREAQLAKVAIFDGLTADALAMIAEVTTEEEQAAGTRLFSYGEPGDKLYILVEGKVRISREVGGMGEEALAVLGPGDVFGEMSLLDESPRSADAHAHEKCRLLVITKDAFDDLLFLHKDLAYEVLWSCVRMLASRLRETNDKLTFLSTSGRF
jgi:CRP/FNR family cyclic AMP-dependent transcriptional regulator